MAKATAAQTAEREQWIAEQIRLGTDPPTIRQITAEQFGISASQARKLVARVMEFVPIPVNPVAARNDLLELLAEAKRLALEAANDGDIAGFGKAATCYQKLLASAPQTMGPLSAWDLELGREASAGIGGCANNSDAQDPSGGLPF
jgi:hypothetical protein